MDPVEVKGKSKPLPVWRAIEPRGRYGIDAAVRAYTPFVGRESEMRLLTEVFRRVVNEGSLQPIGARATGPTSGPARRSPPARSHTHSRRSETRVSRARRRM